MKKHLFLLTVFFQVYLFDIYAMTDPDGFVWNLFEQNGYYGVKDENGKIILSADFNDVESLGNSFLVKCRGFYGLYSRQGACLIPANYFYYYKRTFHDSTAPIIFLTPTSWTAMNQKGNILVPEDNYEFIEIYKDSGDNYYFICCKDGFWGVYDGIGRCIIPPNKYSSIYKTGNKVDGYYYSFLIYGEGSGVCDSSGKEIIRTRYQITQREKKSNGEIYYKICNGNKWGEMDINGNVISEPIIAKKDISYNQSVCKDNNIRSKYKFMCDGNSKYGIMDKSYNIIIPFEYDWIRHSKDYVIVYKGHYMGAFTFDGKCVLAPNYYTAVWGDDGGYLHVKKNGKHGLINKCGQFVLPVEYSYLQTIFSRTDSIIVANSSENRKAGLFNKEKQILPFEFDNAGVLYDPQVKDSVIYYIGYKNGREGIYDKSGNQVVEPIYPRVNYKREGGIEYFVLYNGFIQGVMDMKGNIIIPPNYFYSITFEQNKFIAKCGDHICHFDIRGNLLSDNRPELERDKWIQKADDAFENENYESAAKYYASAINIRPSASLYYNRAVSFYNINDYNNAIIDFKNCLSSTPSQELIDKSKYLIRKSREYQANKKERRLSIAANVLGLVFGVSKAVLRIKQAGVYRSNTANGYIRDTSRDYLLDPNYAYKQVQLQNWNEYMATTNGGVLMSYEEWYSKIKTPAVLSEHNNANLNNDIDTGTSSIKTNQLSASNCDHCAGTGNCKTCNGSGYFYSTFGTGRVVCPNCKNHEGKCSFCGGTGKR